VTASTTNVVESASDVFKRLPTLCAPRASYLGPLSSVVIEISLLI
jgi:hypothetical protein